MSKKKQPQHINVTWIRHEGLALALLNKNHRLYETYDARDRHQFRWLYVTTPRLLKDIEKYEARALKVDAHTYHIYLTGKFYDDDEKGEK